MVSASMAATLLGVTPGQVYYLAKTKQLKRVRTDAFIFRLCDVPDLRMARQTRRRARPTVEDRVAEVMHEVTT
jgi:hypothetical protein